MAWAFLFLGTGVVVMPLMQAKVSTMPSYFYYGTAEMSVSVKQERAFSYNKKNQL